MGRRRNLSADAPLLAYLDAQAKLSSATTFSKQVIELVEIGIRARDGGQAMADINTTREKLLNQAVRSRQKQQPKG